MTACSKSGAGIPGGPRYCGSCGGRASAPVATGQGTDRYAPIAEREIEMPLESRWHGLELAVARYINQGCRLSVQADTSAQLLKLKKYRLSTGLGLLVIFPGVGALCVLGKAYEVGRLIVSVSLLFFIISLVHHFSRPEQAVFLSLDLQGHVAATAQKAM